MEERNQFDPQSAGGVHGRGAPGGQAPGYGVRRPDAPVGARQTASPPMSGAPSGYGVRQGASGQPPQPPRQPARREAGSDAPRRRRPQPPEPPRRGRNIGPPDDGDGGSRWIRALLMVLVTIGGCVFLAFFLLGSVFDWSGLNQEDKDIIVVVPEGSTTKDIGALLADSGVIQNSIIFRVYAGIKSEEGDLLAGRYIFNSNLSYDEIIVYLKRGDSEREEVRLTFREGRTVAEIAGLLEEYKVCSAADFLAYLETCDYDYEYFNALPDEEMRFRRLEGYIFPDTYDFFVGENVSEVAKKFLSNFNIKITDEMQVQMRELGLSIDETIILASIIQKEAGRVEDMRKVSSVFHNRMAMTETYPKLQSDVTIFYVNDEIKPYLEQTDQEMYDAYNTYVCNGLPVGPICNPGMDAIEAALNPAETGYYFFVTDKNEDFYYAATADEHARNVAEAKSVGGEAHGIDTQ